MYIKGMKKYLVPNGRITLIDTTTAEEYRRVTEEKEENRRKDFQP
jgi:hypothetical protein